MKNLTLVCLVVLLVRSPVQAQEFTHSFQLYGMATSIDGDAGIGRATGVQVDVDFNTILDTLEMAGLFNYQLTHRSGWGLAVDYAFMDLGADIENPAGGIIDAGVRQGVFELLLMKGIGHRPYGVRYFGGIRWWDNDIDLLLDPAILPGDIKINVEEDWVDFILGVFWRTQLSQRWDFEARGDMGLGGTDFTSGLWAGVRYRASDSWSLDLRYKATWVDFEDGNPGRPGYFKYDTVTHGPIIGITWLF